MQARAAYIRSLGTTSILVAAALLMLGMVGALVGFHGWPDGSIGGTVRSVPLQPTPQPVLREVRAVSKTALVRRRAAATGRRLSTAGLVKVVPVKSPQAVGHPVAYTPGHTGQGVPQQSPTAAGHVGPVTPPSNPPSDPQQLLTQVVDSVQPPPSDGAPPGLSLPSVSVPGLQPAP